MQPSKWLTGYDPSNFLPSGSDAQPKPRGTLRKYYDAVMADVKKNDAATSSLIMPVAQGIGDVVSWPFRKLAQGVANADAGIGEPLRIKSKSWYNAPDTGQMLSTAVAGTGDPSDTGIYIPGLGADNQANPYVREAISQGAGLVGGLLTDPTATGGMLATGGMVAPMLTGTRVAGAAGKVGAVERALMALGTGASAEMGIRGTVDAVKNYQEEGFTPKTFGAGLQAVTGAGFAHLGRQGLEAARLQGNGLGAGIPDSGLGMVERLPPEKFSAWNPERKADLMTGLSKILSEEAPAIHEVLYNKGQNVGQAIVPELTDLSARAAWRGPWEGSNVSRLRFDISSLEQLVNDGKLSAQIVDDIIHEVAHAGTRGEGGNLPHENKFNESVWRGNVQKEASFSSPDALHLGDVESTPQLRKLLEERGRPVAELEVTPSTDLSTFRKTADPHFWTQEENARQLLRPNLENVRSKVEALLKENSSKHELQPLLDSLGPVSKISGEAPKKGFNAQEFMEDVFSFGLGPKTLAKHVGSIWEGRKAKSLDEVKGRYKELADRQKLDPKDPNYVSESRANTLRRELDQQNSEFYRAAKKDPGPVDSVKTQHSLEVLTDRKAKLEEAYKSGKMSQGTYEYSVGKIDSELSRIRTEGVAPVPQSGVPLEGPKPGPVESVKPGQPDTRGTVQKPSSEAPRTSQGQPSAKAGDTLDPMEPYRKNVGKKMDTSSGTGVVEALEMSTRTGKPIYRIKLDNGETVYRGIAGKMEPSKKAAPISADADGAILDSVLKNVNSLDRVKKAVANTPINVKGEQIKQPGAVESVKKVAEKKGQSEFYIPVEGYDKPVAVKAESKAEALKKFNESTGKTATEVHDSISWQLKQQELARAEKAKAVVETSNTATKTKPRQEQGPKAETATEKKARESRERAELRRVENAQKKVYTEETIRKIREEREAARAKKRGDEALAEKQARKEREEARIDRKAKDLEAELGEKFDRWSKKADKVFDSMDTGPKVPDTPGGKEPPKYGKLHEILREAAGFPRAVKSSWDLSAPLRQAVFYTLNPMHAGQTTRAMGAMFKSLVSKENFTKVDAEIKSRPLWEASEKAGIQHSDILTHSEEAFASKLASKVPGVKFSERAYVAYLNKIRADVFDSMAEPVIRDMNRVGTDAAKAEGEAHLKSIAKYVNNATGVGDVGGITRSPLISDMFYSPKFMSSRINMLTQIGRPSFWKGMPKSARKQVLLDYAGYMAGVGAALGLAQLAGATVETDPASSDFMKAKFGNTRIDLSGGMQPYIRNTYSALNKRKKATSGIEYVEKPKHGQRKYELGRELVNFGRSKLAPVPAAIADQLFGKTVINEDPNGQSRIGKALGLQPVGKYEKPIENLVAPMFPMDVMESFQKGGSPGAAIPLGLFGAGAQTYDAKQRKSGRKKKPVNYSRL